MICLGENTAIFPSKGEVRSMIKGGGVSMNKNRIDDEAYGRYIPENLLNDRYLLVQKGKKNYYLITCK